VFADDTAFLMIYYISGEFFMFIGVMIWLWKDIMKKQVQQLQPTPLVQAYTRFVPISSCYPHVLTIHVVSYLMRNQLSPLQGNYALLWGQGNMIEKT